MKDKRLALLGIVSVVIGLSLVAVESMYIASGLIFLGVAQQIDAYLKDKYNFWD